MCEPSGSSSFSFPSSRSIRIARATNVFVIEAIAYCVSGVASRLLSTSARPTDSAQSRSSPRKSAAVALGAGLSRWNRISSRRRSATSDSGADKGSEGAWDRLHRLVDVLVLDPEIGGGTEHAGAHDRDEHALVANSLARLGSVHPFRQRDADEVGVDGLPVDCDASVVEALGEPPCAGMVVSETIDVVVERVQR